MSLPAGGDSGRPGRGCQSWPWGRGGGGLWGERGHTPQLRLGKKTKRKGTFQFTFKPSKYRQLHLFIDLASQEVAVPPILSISELKVSYGQIVLNITSEIFL